MFDSMTAPASVILDLLRMLFASLDRPAYAILGVSYELFFNVASADLFSNSMIMKFYGRVQVILGVFMMFQLAMTILRGIVNPEGFTKDKGAGTLITRVVTSLLLITLLMPINIPNARNEYEKQVNNNGLLFGTLYSLQHRILANNTIGRLVLGTNDTSQFDTSVIGEDTELKKSSRIFTSTILKGFYRINLVPEDQRSNTYITEGKDPAVYNENRVCTDISDEILELYTRVDANPGDILDLAIATCDSDAKPSFLNDLWTGARKLTGTTKYIFTFTPLVSFIVPVIFIVILLSFTVDIAVRAVKLAVLRLIAPIPLIAYMDPQGGKDSAFNSWVKTLTSTYLDLFIRLATVYFVIYLIQDMIVNGITINTSAGHGVLHVLSMILIWIGLFAFAKQAPKFIKQVLGLKEDLSSPFSGFGELGAAMGIAAAGLGSIGSARTNYRAAKEENAQLHPDSSFNGIRNVGSAIAGAIGGGMTGIRAAVGKDGGVKSVLDAQSQRNARRAAHSTLPGRVESDIYGAFTGRSLATRDQATLDANKAAASSIKTFKSTAVDEAMKKGKWGTVSASKDRFGRLAGIEFNYRQLESAISTKDSSGNFNYTDHNGAVHRLNAAWFDSNVMADIEDSQTANYLRDDYDSTTGEFNNGKIQTDWRNAKHDMSEASLNYRGQYLGDISVGTDQNGGDYAYGDIGKNIGAANKNVADMSTNMRNIMNRANSQGKK